MRVALVLLMLIAFASPAWAQETASEMDIIATVPASGAPTQTGDAGVLTLVNESPERVEWRIAFEGSNVAIELRIARTFGVERAEQIVPLLMLDANESRCLDVRAKGACDDATFMRSPSDRVWEAGDVARAYHRNGTLGDLVLRLNVPGPANGSLVLVPDTAPPVVTPGEPTLVTHIGFQLETRTDELAIVDVQVRKVGASEWVVNPTPDLNLLQRFPIQGLDADTDYEYRIVARDWSGNEVIGPIQRVRSAPAPVRPIPEVSIVDPAPNATLQRDGMPIVVRAVIDSPESPVAASGIQMFFDKRAVTEGIVFDGRNLTYTPRDVVAAGHHSVSVEATNALGGKGVARSSFDLVDAKDAPGAGVAAALLSAAAALLLRRRA